MRRILVLLSVVAMMVVMLAMSVAPAFAAKDASNCRLSDKFTTTAQPIPPGRSPDRNGDGIICVYISNEDPADIRFADNHPALRPV
jgi:hypothetical protein